MGGGGGPIGGVARRDMEAIRYMTALALHRPQRLTVTVDDSVFVLAPSSGAHSEVPTAGEEVEVPIGPRPVRARIRWNDLQPSLERAIEGGGRIVDDFEVIDGSRLILTRTVEFGRGRDLRLVFVYDREGM